jgi:hypothetical protein
VLSKLFFIASLFFFELYATPCQNPAVASDKLGKKFRYGCFCGKNYPHIEHASKKSFRDLNGTARQELILQYKKIDAYDDIDAICKKHDICYIYYGKKAKICNDKAYDRFDIIKKKFDKASENKSSNKQCKNLAYDMGSVFHTIFLPADDENTIFDFGILMLNGVITVTNRVVQKSADRMSRDSSSRYPLPHQKCLLEPINQKK